MTMSKHDLEQGRGKGPRAGQAQRRSFTAEYKARIIAEYDAAEPNGAKGEILRREGLYESSISRWKAKSAQAPAGGGPARATDATRQSGSSSSDRARIAKLEAQLERANKQLATNEAALELLGKGFALLEMISGSADSRNS